MTKEATVDLDSDDPRVPEVRDLVDRIDFRAVQSGQPRARPLRLPTSATAPTSCQVHEPELTPELRQLATLVLGD